MKNIKLSLGLLFACVLLTACSDYNKVGYLKAQSIPAMKIPPGTSSTDMTNYYPIPETKNQSTPKKPVDLTPPDVATQKLKEVPLTKQELAEAIPEQKSSTASPTSGDTNSITIPTNPS